MPPLSPIIGTVTTHPNNEQINVPVLEYSEAAKKYINYRRQRIIAARDVRDAPHQEFDDLPFLSYWDILKRADDQYVAPRKNKTDTSINTGTIRDKDTSLVEYAQKYDFEPIAETYDEDDNMLEDMADTMEDMVRKSFLLEDFKSKAKLISRSMVAFGTALVEDHWMERWVKEKEFGRTSDVGKGKADWSEKMVKQYDGCQAKLWDLRKCYFGDIRKFFLNGSQGQPYFFTVEYESYDVVKKLFGDWDRFKYVPNYVTFTPELAGAQVYSSWWTLRPISMNYVEILRYYDPFENEYAITLNGVDMLPIQEKKTKVEGVEKTLISGFPLTKISPSGMINFSKFDLEPMHDFAYSKSQPGKMRVLADVENMFFKLILGMMKQKAKPTLGNKSGKNFDESVTEPGQVVNDIREGDLFPILPNVQGATPADFSFFELLKKELAKNSVEDSFQGINNQATEETATQNLNNMKSSGLKVAAMFDGLISGYTQLFWLRTYNIIANWTKPIDIHIDIEKRQIENKYRTITVPSGNKNGVKKIVFTTKTPKRAKGKPTLEDSQKIHQMEMDHKKETGQEVSIVHLNPEVLASIKLNWFYYCIPVINENDPMAYMMFAKQMGDAIAAFGINSLRVKKLKHEFAKMTGKDFDT